MSDGGGGWGQRGEIQFTRTDDESRRKIPIRVAWSMVKVRWIVLAAIYLIVWFVWWTVLSQLYDAPSYYSGFHRWLSTTRFVLGAWGGHMLKWGLLWLIPFLIVMPWPLLLLYKHNLYPKTMNDEWPPPSAQIDPMEAGALTWDNWDERAGLREQEVLEPEIIVVDVKTKDEGGHVQNNRLDIPNGDKYPNWVAFLSHVVQNADDFTEDIAKNQYGIPVTLARGVGFRQLRQQVLKRQMGEWFNERAHQQGFILYDEALEAFVAYVRHFTE